MEINKEWKFNDVENTAVFTTMQVINEDMPILYVSHDEEDGAWQFHHGENINIEDAMIVSLAHMVYLDGTLTQLVDLPLGWIATRKSINDSWKKERK
ncbi:hypothetical protein SAMN02745163_02955 [Clostridium cavendishii DSM 21758]|uniref:DUF2185 domain-containing protein n=1 Tax=Clostridium cavendishii DSM 21758 TaxID=1121302 RepID=A0A1M6NN76_9CLOT|nr:hypothetical protein [Clostridium cavendishii]SHJ97022.1 hypothetical protein SAMN02745163_02955 [Clostridium cavendishii DSM 21758]